MFGLSKIVGAPSFFPTIWSWIKRWLDPIVVAKIHVLSPKQVLPALSDQVGIENVPLKYGGQLDWRFGDLPNIDPALLELVQPIGTTQVKVPIGPMRWVRNGDGEMVMTALGSRDGSARSRRVAVLRSPYKLYRVADEAK